MKTLAIFFIVHVFTYVAGAAILLEEPSRGRSVQSLSGSKGAPSASTYADGQTLRKDRPIAVGPVVGGSLGLVGLQGALNINSLESLAVGFGGGEGFRSLSIQARRVFAGTYLLPYVAGGYTRWFSVGPGAVSHTDPEFLYSNFLSESSRESGHFGENIIFPSAGLEYLQLHGPLTGLSIFIEVTALVDLNRLVMAPTGSIGTLYYF